MYPINAQQLHSLIHEIVSTYVWQFLARLLNYNRQTCKPDFTAQWETLSEALSADIGKNLSHYFTITTAHEAQHRLDDILALVSNELASRTAVSETDRRLGLNEAWDTWRQMMQEDNWGYDPGYYVAGEHVGENIESVIDHLRDPDTENAEQAVIELHLPREEHHRWSYAEFCAEYDH